MAATVGTAVLFSSAEMERGAMRTGESHRTDEPRVEDVYDREDNVVSQSTLTL